MSMNAVFVQIEEGEIARLEADPDSAEALFAGQDPANALLANAAAAMQERLRAIGPEKLSAALSRLPDPVRQQFEASLSHVMGALGSSQGGRPDLAAMVQERLAGEATATREVLSLEKAWHGLHYLLSGTAEPGPELRSQAVLGGVELGDDPEGFGGYGPARYFRADRVRELSAELSRPELESEVAARFDPAEMTRLHIYPGWRAGEEDGEWLLDAFRRLRDFYASAAAQGRAVVTCLL